MTADTLTTRDIKVSAPERPPRRASRPRMTPRNIVSQVLLTIVLLLFLLPFAWMISNSLKPPDEIFTLNFLGSEIRWGNYAEAWGYLPFGRFMLNGLFVAL